MPHPKLFTADNSKDLCQRGFTAKLLPTPVKGHSGNPFFHS